LTEAQFCKAVEAAGFSSSCSSSALFEELPLRDDRTVQHGYIMGSIAARGASDNMKLFLFAMACPPRSTPLKRAVKRRVWRSGPIAPPIPSKNALMRRQMLLSAHATEAPLRGEHELGLKRQWFEALDDRNIKENERSMQVTDKEHCKLDLLEAQLDALSVLSDARVFVNPVDRVALNRMLSRMRSLQNPRSLSILSDPEVVVSTTSTGSINTERQTNVNKGSATVQPTPGPVLRAISEGGKVGHSLSSETLLAHTVKFAHRRCPAATTRALQPASMVGSRIRRQVAWSVDTAHEMRTSAAKSRVLSAHPNLQFAQNLHAGQSDAHSVFSVLHACPLD